MRAPCCYCPPPCHTATHSLFACWRIGRVLDDALVGSAAAEGASSGRRGAVQAGWGAHQTSGAEELRVRVCRQGGTLLWMCVHVEESPLDWHTGQGRQPPPRAPRTNVGQLPLLLLLLGRRACSHLAGVLAAPRRVRVATPGSAVAGVLAAAALRDRRAWGTLLAQ